MLMFFSVIIFTSTEDGIAKKLLLFKIEYVAIFNLLIILIDYFGFIMLDLFWSQKKKISLQES